jgi:hypothetical protein
MRVQLGNAEGEGNGAREGHASSQRLMWLSIHNQAGAMPGSHP